MDTTGSNGGWRIAEAIRRCVDPDVLAAWFAARRDWRREGSPTQYSWRNEDIEGDVAERHNAETRITVEIMHRHERGFTQLGQAMKNLLRAGKLIAWGRPESALAAPVAIPASAWEYLYISNVCKSILTEATKSKVQILDVRIYPVVQAPDAIEYLAGRTFLEAFQKAVVDDPQIVVLNKRVTAVRGELASFGYDWDSYRAVWSVDHGRNLSGLGAVGYMHKFDNPTKYNRELAAKRSAAQRFAALINYLAIGELVAEGTPAGGGKAVPIPRSLWQRDRTYIDLLNGDLLEMDPQAEDHTTALSKPTFTGLMLLRPSMVDQSQSADADGHPASVARPGKAAKRVVTKIGAESACFKWLSDLMSANPTGKLHTKDEYWQQAQAKWSGKLARRGFERAWDNAVQATNAVGWSASGRPPKSPQA